MSEKDYEQDEPLVDGYIETKYGQRFPRIVGKRRDELLSNPHYWETAEGVIVNKYGVPVDENGDIIDDGS